MVDKLTRREFVRDTAMATAGIAMGLNTAQVIAAGNPQQADTSKILNYNPDMEYRRCGGTGWMVSAVCLGGHWKRVDAIIGGNDIGGWTGNIDRPDFQKNRHDVVSRCIDRGINYIDACTGGEVMAYSRALKGRRDKMYLGYSWYEKEMRNAEYRTFGKLKQGFEEGLKEAGLDYVDLWRVTCHEGSGAHTDGEIEELVKALDWAKKSGLARETGISSHDRPHIKKLIEKYPEQMNVIVTPFTAKTKVEATGDQVGLWEAMKKLDVGWFGIKPFASNSVFKGTSKPGDPHEADDNRMARLIIRAILCNLQITAPIPGLVTEQQVDNVCLAVKERRELDQEEKAELERAMDRAWANLPYHYQWLKNWEYV